MEPNNSNNLPPFDMYGNPINPNAFNSPMSQFPASNPNFSFNSPQSQFPVYNPNYTFNSPNPYYMHNQYHTGAYAGRQSNYSRMMMDSSTNDPSSTPDPETPTAGSNPIPDIPLFSTQQATEDEACSPQKKTGRAEWTAKEDELLISAWLNTSKDSITGNQQKSTGFWKKIKAYYDEHRTRQMRDRGDYAVFKNRWYRLSAIVNKFAGCYARVVQRHQSGQSQEDIIACAQQLYKDETKKNFVAMHAWRMLRNEAKWQSEYGPQPVDSSSSKRTKNSATGAYTSSSNAGSAGPEPISPADDWVLPSTHAERPIGQKAAKRKEKEIARSSSGGIGEFSKYFDQVQVTNEKRIEAIARAAEAKARAEEAKARAAEAKAPARAAKAKMRQYELDVEVLGRDTSKMDAAALECHYMMVAKIKKRLSED